MNSLLTLPFVNGRLSIKERDRLILKEKGIYRIRCLANSRIYVGSTACHGGFIVRFRSHSSELRLGTHGNWKLLTDYKRHGSDAFVFEILEIVLKENCIVREQFYLDLLKVGNNDQCYNIEHIASIDYDALKKAAKLRKGKPCFVGTRYVRKVGFIVTQPNGAELYVENLAEFCRQQRSQGIPLYNGSLREVALGKRISIRGFKCRYQDPKLAAKYEVKTRRTTSRGWIVTSPDGQEYFVEMLYPFCLAHGLSTTNMSKIATRSGRVKSWKGWTCRYFDEESNPRKPIKETRFRKQWLVVSPEGIEQEVNDLPLFCKSHGLDTSAMSKVALGKNRHHKGWTCRHL